MRPLAYYNEMDAYAAQWLRNLVAARLIPAGDVDDRDIRIVQPDDLRGYTQCHFFAGIAGWSHALRLAGWPDERLVWTGSCPCQPFSSAARGRGLGLQCDRHLWPAWANLIDSCRPPVLFGEQVAQARDWLDQVCNDLAAMGYATWAGVLPACSVGADHIRERIYLVGHADHEGQPGLPVNAEVARLPGRDCHARGVVPADGIPNRMAVLRAFGNAVVPPLAAEVIGAFLASEQARAA
jgi:DNA (cytosine-5)-methyltransferase 1